MNASKSINIKIAIILTAKINRIILKEIFAANSNVVVHMSTNIIFGWQGYWMGNNFHSKEYLQRYQD